MGATAMCSFVRQMLGVTWTAGSLLITLSVWGQSLESPLFAADGDPQSTSQANSSPDRPAQRVVVRVSKSLLESLNHGQKIAVQRTLQDVILGTSVYGRTQVVGKPIATLVEDTDEAAFEITFTGQATSNSTGYNGPAIISSHAITSFVATKRVVFEPGAGFRGLPPQVAARTQIFVDGIDSTTRGLVGRIVRRGASETEAAQHAEVTEIVRQKTMRRIAAEFEQGRAERLDRLNSMADLSAIIALVSGNEEPKDQSFVCCTTRPVHANCLWRPRRCKRKLTRRPGCDDARPSGDMFRFGFMNRS